MTKILTAASVLAIAGAASAAQFQFLGAAAGGNGAQPGVNGAGFTPVGGSFHQDLAAGSNFSSGINLAFLDFVPAARNDTYASISAIGPVVGATASADDRLFYGDLAPGGATNAGGTLIEAPGGVYSGAAMYFGIGVSPQPFLSGKAPLVGGGGRSDFDAVFLGRFTVTGGGSVAGGAEVSLKDVGDPATYQGIVAIGGGPVQIGAAQYELIPFLVGQRTEGNVHDLWLVQIPTPGALALFGLGGVAAIRRRRA